MLLILALSNKEFFFSFSFSSNVKVTNGFNKLTLLVNACRILLGDRNRLEIKCNRYETINDVLAMIISNVISLINRKKTSNEIRNIYYGKFDEE